MAQIFIEETTLTAIGDAIRGKEGTTELVPVNDMATRITNLPSGGGGGGYVPTDEELTITGDGKYKFYGGSWDWVVREYGDRMTTSNIKDASFMFMNTDLEEISFQINLADNTVALSNLFNNAHNLKVCPKVRGSIDWSKSTVTIASCTQSNYRLRDIEDLFTPEMIEGVSTFKITSAYTCPKIAKFNDMYSLRRVPSWFYKYRLNPESTAQPSSSYTLYNMQFSQCYVIDEIKDVPVWVCVGNLTSNAFTGFISSCFRLKAMTFETNEDGTPIVANWKSQTLDFTYAGSETLTTQYQPITKDNALTAANLSKAVSYNSGITPDKMIYNEESYQALKNDPDSFVCTVSNIPNGQSPYSRYNHDSAVETINSLPDTSAYLATAGGTNTIKFNGKAGSKTDGGAINTLTEEEIAVATAKGWTVTIS